MNTNGHESEGLWTPLGDISTAHCFVRRFRRVKVLEDPVFIRVDSCLFVVVLNSYG
jgi:hypothetical protein